MLPLSTSTLGRAGNKQAGWSEPKTKQHEHEKEKNTRRGGRGGAAKHNTDTADEGEKGLALCTGDGTERGGVGSVATHKPQGEVSDEREAERPRTKVQK